MSIISVVSPKGGAGKSTLTVTMATMLAKLGVNVCVVDADPQQTVKRWYYGSKEDDKVKTSHQINLITDVNEETFYEVVPCLKVQLVKREAYRQMFYDRLGIDELPSPDPNKAKKVVENALKLVQEVLQFLKQSQQSQQSQL